jgi:hypothetical protein
MNRLIAWAAAELRSARTIMGRFGNRARVSMSTKWIVFFAIAAGGCSGGGGDSASFLWFEVSQGPKALQVYVNNSYAFLVDPDPGSCYEPPGSAGWLPPCPDSGVVDSGGTPGMVKRGQLDEATVSALRGYFTDEKIGHYQEGYQSYADDCHQHGLRISWGQRGISACWYPAEVADPATSEMLQYVGNLFESIANR